jgi:hypothetical protein
MDKKNTLTIPLVHNINERTKIKMRENESGQPWMTKDDVVVDEC